MAGVSLFPDWMTDLPLQQQAVLILACRGPDGDPKHTPFKVLLRAYRATVMRAAYTGRFCEWGERQGSFMGLDVLADDKAWDEAVTAYLEDFSDAAVNHAYTHFMHGAEVLGYKHPDERIRRAWAWTYLKFVDKWHLNPETEEQMNERLNDWGRMHWE